MISYKCGWMGFDGFRCAPHILRILALAAVLLLMSSAQAQSAAPRKPSGYVPASAAPLQVLRLPGEKAIKLYANSYALVIGASDYANGWRKLPGVPDDVAAVSQALSAQGFDVTIVTDPTLAQMEAALRKFIAEFGQAPENRLIVYYAGHGHTLKTNDGRQLGYIVPVDAPRPNNNVGAFKAKALGMESFEFWAKEIESKHALFVFDSCFSGTIFITRASDVPEIISLKTTQPVRQFITAGGADQKVPDESIFRRQFIEGIKGGADRDKDGYITGSELGYFLETTVTNYSRRMQTPKFGPIRDPHLDKGDFVFELARKSAAIVGAPAAPIGGGFNLEDLKRQDTTRKQWEQWQGKMKADFEAVSRFDGSAELKVEAWNRFLTSYGQDNPFSTEDEPLRALAKQKREQAQGDDERRKHEADAAAAQRAEAARQEEALRRLTTRTLTDAQIQIIKKGWLTYEGSWWESSLGGIWNNLRSSALFGETFTTLKEVEVLLNVKVFISEPHAEDLSPSNDGYRYSFGYLNKNFVKWATINLIPGAEDDTFRASTQKIYDDNFRNTARIYFMTHKTIAYGDFLDKELKWYKTQLINKTLPEDWFYKYTSVLGNIKELKEGSIDPDFVQKKLLNTQCGSCLFGDITAFEYLVTSSTAFWVRREMDGTSDEFFSALIKLLETYDKTFIKKYTTSR
ncbi:MAG: caspase family protein [Sulfuricellaceae bacterium]